MDRQTWLTTNEEKIMSRLKGLAEAPDGLLFVKQSGAEVVVVDKAKSMLRLWTFNPSPKLVQSRLDLRRPLHLISPYQQAALLGLVWKDKPQRVYMAGLGGGRLALVLHHYLPQVIIETAEFDPVMIEVAGQYFGIQADDRLVIAPQDARAYLAERDADTVYDIILNDAFSSGSGPVHLATQQFYEVCQNHLAKNGVVIVNLLSNDPLYTEKIKTIQSIFDHLYLWLSGWGNGLVFASNKPLPAQTELVEQVQALQAYHRFSFSLVDRANELELELDLNEHLPELAQAAILADAARLSS
jgi:spermidine synthase